MRKALPLVAAALVAAMGLSGCGSNPTTPGNTGNVPVTNSAWDVNEKTRDQVKEGGEFRGAFGSEIDTWNLNTSEGNDLEKHLMQSALWENWFYEDGSGNHTVNHNYLDSVKGELVNGKQVITFKISDKAKWNDGAPITWADWEATIKAMSGEDEDYDVASSDGYNQVESVVKGATDKDVIITFKEAYPDWEAFFGGNYGGVMRAESVKDSETFNTGWSEYNNAWYAGPYIVTSFEKSSNTVTMERNPNWWGDKGKLDKIIWKYVDSSQMATAFANGEIHYFDIMSSGADAYAQAIATPGAVVRQSGGPNYRHFTFNSKAPVLSDINVRQAIVMGLDRDVIVQSDLVGLPVDLQKARKNSNLFMQGMDGYVDYAEKTGIKYNPDGAKAKLEAAGWAMGTDGYYAKDGKTLEVRFAVLTGVRTSENEAQQAQAMLQKIGVKLTLQPVNTSTEWPSVLTTHNFEIIAFSWMGTAYPLQNIGQLYGGKSDSNYSQLTVPTVEELEPKISTESDDAQRLKLAQQADEAIWQAVMTLPLYQRPALAGVRADLANIGSFGMAMVPLTWVNVGYVA